MWGSQSDHCAGVCSLSVFRLVFSMSHAQEPEVAHLWALRGVDSHMVMCVSWDEQRAVEYVPSIIRITWGVS